jgi:AcrR family transcriptional regulator
MQQRGQLAREAILIAGEELFARFSYTGTTLDAVAKQAGLYKQNLIHYYANKPLLYGAVIEYAFKPIMDINNSVGGVDSAHLNLIERWIDILAERPNIARLIMFGAALPESSAIPPVFRDMNLHGFQSFEVEFKRLVPNAGKDDFYHFACALSGTTLFYAELMGQLTGTISKNDKAQAIAKHKKLILLSVESLIKTMQA